MNSERLIWCEGDDATYTKYLKLRVAELESAYDTSCYLEYEESH